jgi:hypothetical protein
MEFIPGLNGGFLLLFREVAAAWNMAAGRFWYF